VGLRVDPGIVYNAVTNSLTTTTFIGNLTGNCSGSSSSCTGNAATATTSSNIGLTNDITTVSVYIPFTTSSTTTSSASLRVNPNLKYDASTNALTATTFTGALVGNVTGDCMGSSGSCAGNAATATTSTNIGLTNDITTASVYIPFTTDSTTQTSASLRVNPNLKYNASTNALTATTFTGALVGNVTGNCTGSSGSCTGNSSTATTSTNIGLTTDIATASVYIPFTSSSATTSSAVMKINPNLKYNASTNALTATTFSGALVGNVTGNCSGSSGSCTGNAQTAVQVSITKNEFDNVNYALSFSNFDVTGASITGACSLLDSTFLYFNPIYATLTSGNINTSLSSGTNTINGNTVFNNTVTVPTPTNSNSNQVANTSYLTSNYAPIQSGNPTGTIIMLAGASSPAGYLYCNGAGFSPTTYPNLNTVIGYSYGGTASAPLLPDFRGCFLRGYGTYGGNANYASTGIGVSQTDQVGSHNHSFAGAYLKYYGNQSTFAKVAGSSTYLDSAGTFPAYINSNATSASPENRPFNYPVYYYIKT
jgi:microcystin-dependent protein/ribosome-binding factor A